MQYAAPHSSPDTGHPPVNYGAVNVVKRHEWLDVRDSDTRFNPFLVNE